jgi:hypothetical protein
MNLRSFVTLLLYKVVERPVDLRMIRRANSRMQIVNHPVYAYVLWAFTLGSLAAAITELNVIKLLHTLMIFLFVCSVVFSVARSEICCLL